MKNIRLYLLAVSALVVSVGSFLLSGVGASTASASDKDVIVVNTTSNPVPVVPQGSTAVTGTVSVSNFPEAVAIVPAGTPITLRQTLGLAGPIHASEHVVLYDSRSGSTHLNGQIAIGSISIASVSTPSPGEVYYEFSANNCSGNGFGTVRSIVAQTGATTHLDFPIPQVVPDVGAQSPFCMELQVLNGNHAELIDVTAVGSVR